jgi:hypothetical protein
MSPYIRQQILGHAPSIAITDDQFDAIKAARVVLSAAFALEESYDLLIGNYVEVEQELLAAAAVNAARNKDAYDDFFELRATINRRVVNLLTTARLYLDQAPQRLATCAKDPQAARAELKTRTNEHYDALFGYRFLEALRNHVQHCGLAVHSISIKNEWVETGGIRMREISIQPFASRSDLAEDAKFKPSVLKETPEKVVLTHVIREYLQCLGDIHKLVRSHVTENAQQARLTIQQHISAYGDANNAKTLGLAAIRPGPDGEQESVPLFLNWDDVRVKLVSRNSTLTALARHVVTGRAT